MVKFSVYFDRRVFVMRYPPNTAWFALALNTWSVSLSWSASGLTTFTETPTLRFRVKISSDCHTETGICISSVPLLSGLATMTWSSTCPWGTTKQLLLLWTEYEPMILLASSYSGSRGPVVQSVVSLTSSLRVISLTVLAESIYNILIFLLKKCE